MSGDSRAVGFSGNTLKIIAAITMLIDHIGIILLPEIGVLRIIGRISFPIYAYMIAEGCFYTRNKLRYFACIFILGVICQAVYATQSGDNFLGILITFSISIIVVYALQYMKKTLLFKEALAKQILSFIIFSTLTVGVYFLNKLLTIDYGFFGCMAPAFASLFKMPRKIEAGESERKAERTNFLSSPFLKERLPNVILLGICLVFMSFSMMDYQIFAIAALPLLLLYTGRRGRLKMKYFFYVFYPLHLVILEGISYLIK